MIFEYCSKEIRLIHIFWEARKFIGDPLAKNDGIYNVWRALILRFAALAISGKKDDPDGTRTHNLPIRSRTRYPLRHQALVTTFPSQFVMSQHLHVNDTIQTHSLSNICGFSCKLKNNNRTKIVCLFIKIQVIHL